MVPPAPTVPASAAPVVLYDGACGLCDRAVQFILRHDRKGELCFAPLQGEFAARHLGPEPPGGWTTLVLIDGATARVRSDALIAIAGRMGGVWRLAALVRIVPRPLRDWCYDFVAARRLRWFGAAPACRLLAPGERQRFLA